MPEPQLLFVGACKALSDESVRREAADSRSVSADVDSAGEHIGPSSGACASRALANAAFSPFLLAARSVSPPRRNINACTDTAYRSHTAGASADWHRLVAEGTGDVSQRNVLRTVMIGSGPGPAAILRGV